LTVQREQAGATDIQGRLKTLTAREVQVFALVVTGMLNKQIAAELGIVEKTVKVHRARVMEKMRAGSLAELVRLADRAGSSRRPDPPVPGRWRGRCRETKVHYPVMRAAPRL
jgi:Response regulator